MLEVKWSDGEWHPHLHIITGGNWIDHRLIREEWLRLTGDSHIINIKALPRTNDVGAYIAKYVTKGTSVEVWNHPEISAEWIEAIKGVRTCATFGDWRGIRLTDNVDSADDWKYIDTLDKMILRARTELNEPGRETDQSKTQIAVATAILLTLRPPGDDAEEMLIAQ